MSEEKKQRLEKCQRNYRMAKKQNNFFYLYFFFFSINKIGSTVLSYDETCIIKNAFHKTATSINIVGVGINKTL